MVLVTNLPTEILRLILAALADIDIRSLFTSSRTSRAFHRLAWDIIDIKPEDHGIAIHSFIKSQFAAFLNSSGPHLYKHGPIHILPWWASGLIRREKYLRKEASWRRIPFVSESGHLVHWLQYVRYDRRYRELRGGYVGVRSKGNVPGSIDFFFPKGLNLGLYHSALLYFWKAVHGGWELLTETKVEDVQRINVLSSNVAWCFVDEPSHELVESLYVHDRRCAVLFLGDSYRGAGSDREWKEESAPQRLGVDDIWTGDWEYADQKG